MHSKIIEFIYCPLFTSQTDTVWSNDAVITWSPLVLNPIDIISALWPYQIEILLVL